MLDYLLLLVFVLILVFNEEKVIVSVVGCIFKSCYELLEVIVVDDGFIDVIVEVVCMQYVGDFCVQFISIFNGGKVNVVNMVLCVLYGQVIVVFDVDIQFELYIIVCLVCWFVDLVIGVVVGNVKVGNCINFIIIWQVLEYIIVQNFECCVLVVFGVIIVVFGVVGVWWCEVLEQFGGFFGDMLVEDQDFIIVIQKVGYKMFFDVEVIVWIEVLDMVCGLVW